MKATTGIRRLHSAGCPARDSQARCTCGAGYEASVWDAGSGRKIRHTFPTLAAARSWRSDAEQGVRRGTLRATEPVTVNEAADALIEGMLSGAVRNRSGDLYKPSAARSYRASLDLHVRDDLGAMRLGDVKRRHVQALADRLVADGLSPSTVRNALMPLRVIFRRALRDDLVALNPCDGIELPANRGSRDRIVSVEHAAALISALTEPSDRALRATAFYAGLRRGELMASAGVTFPSREARCTSSVPMTRRRASTSRRSHGQGVVGFRLRVRSVTRSTAIVLVSPSPAPTTSFSERAGSRSGTTLSLRAPAPPGRPLTSTQSGCTRRGIRRPR
jgi:hypothetical protein